MTTDPERLPDLATAWETFWHEINGWLNFHPNAKTRAAMTAFEVEVRRRVLLEAQPALWNELLNAATDWCEQAGGVEQHRLVMAVVAFRKAGIGSFESVQSTPAAASGEEKCSACGHEQRQHQVEDHFVWCAACPAGASRYHQHAPTGGAAAIEAAPLVTAVRSYFDGWYDHASVAEMDARRQTMFEALTAANNVEAAAVGRVIPAEGETP